MAEKDPEYRIEKDSMGQMNVPINALYGASTQRAVLNFPISGQGLPLTFTRTIGLLKFACAQANHKLGLLDKEKAELIEKAAIEVFEGKLDAHFPVDIFQTGSCTSSNMNVNEVIANHISQVLGKPIGSKIPVHPNDDVNHGQSSNDTMPTVLHISTAVAVHQKLIPALKTLAVALGEKSEAWKEIVKIGRTHLMDATPMTLGQEFSGYETQVRKGVTRMEKAVQALMELAIGGTAVGTGINTDPRFSETVVEIIAEKTGLPFIQARNHFEAQAARDDCVEVAGYLNTLVASLSKIANDIRMLSSGPRSGLAEISLPATQPGSSIMPGKVNPVMCEMLVQVCIYTMGMCNTVSMCGRDGQFELNVTIPLIAHALLTSIEYLTNAIQVFTNSCVKGIEPNIERCRELVERSLMLVTALNPHIGYDKAAYVAKKAFKEGKSLKEVILSENILDEATLEEVLDPTKMI